MKKLLYATLVALVVVGLVGSPATAQTKVRKDKVGDAYRYTDIRSVKVQNNVKNFAVTVRLTTLRQPGTYLSLTVNHGKASSGRGFYLWVVPQPRGRHEVEARPIGSQDQPSLSCAENGVRTKAGKRGFVRVVIPQSCLGSNAGRQAVTVSTGDLDHTGDYLSEFTPPARSTDTVSVITTRRG